MTPKPRYFQPLDLPRYTYIWEAIMWVGFGRFPRGSYWLEDIPENEDDTWIAGDLSLNWQDAPFMQEYRFHGFLPFEAEAVGLDYESTDWDLYDDVLRTVGHVRPELLTNEISRLHTSEFREDGFTRALSTSAFGAFEKLDHNGTPYLKRLEKRLAIAPFIDSVHRLFQRQIDRAWVKVFQALADGSLQGFGWCELTQDEIRTFTEDMDQEYWEKHVTNNWEVPKPTKELIGPLPPMAIRRAIPVSDWTLSGIDADAHYLAATGRLWRSVVFSSQALFSLFPRPNMTAGSDKMHIEHLTPSLAISSAVDGGDDVSWPSSSFRSRPGKPKKANGAIERACQELFGKQLAAGQKEMALASEAADFVRKVWGEKLSRTTFQEYMKPFRPAKGKGAPRLPDNLSELPGE